METPIVFFRLDRRDRHKILGLKNINLTYAHLSTEGIEVVERASGTHNKDVGHILQNIFDAYKKSKNGYVIIDEWVFFRNTRPLREAVIQAKRLFPDIKIIMWNSTLVTSKVAKFYREYVDIVFLETYWPWKSRFMMWLFFKFMNYRNLKKYGMVTSSIFVLGINDNKEKRREDFPEDLWGALPWANDEETLRTQMEYIKEKCRGTIGIGFFVKERASNEIIQTADRLAGEIF